MQLIVYEKRTCTTCRRLAALLAEAGVDMHRVEYQVEGLDGPTVRRLVAAAGITPREALRMREPGAREVAALDDEGIIAAIAERPELLQRPFVVRGDRAVLARPIERVRELL